MNAIVQDLQVMAERASFGFYGPSALAISDEFPDATKTVYDYLELPENNIYMMTDEERSMFILFVAEAEKVQ